MAESMDDAHLRAQPPAADKSDDGQRDDHNRGLGGAHSRLDRPHQHASALPGLWFDQRAAGDSQGSGRSGAHFAPGGSGGPRRHRRRPRGGVRGRPGEEDGKRSRFVSNNTDNYGIESQITNYTNLLYEFFGTQIISLNNVTPSTIPSSSGVYRIIDHSSKTPSTIYIGESGNLRKRICSNHLLGNTHSSTLLRKILQTGNYTDLNGVKNYLRNNCSIQYLIIESKSERMRLEHFAIAILGPHYNQ